ncbi:MAG: GGDEF domain-containing protein [Acidobacteria bacterium]|nr:GGDEF domain-containing protein [Acidobacteriota bacterium]
MTDDLIPAETYRLLVEESLVGVYMIQDERLLYANRRLGELFGYSREEMLQLPSVLDVIAKSHQETVRETMRRRLDGEINEIEYTVRGVRKDGNLIYLDVRSVRAQHRGRPAVIGTMVDITAQKQFEEALRTLALVDELTGLYNRRGFVTLAERQLSLARRKRLPLVLIAADVDGLKGINDQFGHAVGDQALVAAASVLRQTYREADIVARLGGDEFTVFPLEASADSTPLLISRLDTNIRAYNERHQREFTLSLSTGVALLEGELSKDVQQLLAEADSQLYQQKRERGRLQRAPALSVPFWAGAHE